MITQQDLTKLVDLASRWARLDYRRLHNDSNPDVDELCREAREELNDKLDQMVAGASEMTLGEKILSHCSAPFMEELPVEPVEDDEPHPSMFRFPELEELLDRAEHITTNHDSTPLAVLVEDLVRTLNNQFTRL